MEWLGKHEAAERLARRALKASAKWLGEDNPGTLHIIGDIAKTYNGRQMHAQAEEMQVIVTDVFRKGAVMFFEWVFS